MASSRRTKNYLHSNNKKRPSRKSLDCDAFKGNRGRRHAKNRTYYGMNDAAAAICGA